MIKRITFILSIIILLFFLIGWNALFFVKSVVPMEHTGLYWTVYWALSLSYILSRLVERWMPAAVATGLRIVGSCWMAVAFYAFLLLPIADLAWLVMVFTSVAYADYMPVLSAVFGLALFIILARGVWNAWSPIVRTYSFTVAKEAGDLKELQVVAASDLHLGATVRRRYLDVLVRHVNALQPDLVLLPGDVLDDSLEPFIRQRMADSMKRLQARFGVFAVLGNHEYFGGHIQDYVRRMKEIGIEVLMDRVVRVADRFYVAGRKDKTAEHSTSEGRLPHEALLEGTDKSLPILMMDHQPYGYDQALESGVDVLLSGHTHRGQMAPNFLVTRRLFELDWGYKQKGSLHAIVSSGYGTWGPPIRLGSRSEIVRLVIRFETP
ncbi:metallophosphoesterase [Paenibacillus sp. HJGM_3]|uniref:metallophosphoesterase n=1 Tax=Paenibacillus sp. HJGM_3 TaxID=3379816 RepID=UPI00385DDFFE